MTAPAAALECWLKHASATRKKSSRITKLKLSVNWASTHSTALFEIFFPLFSIGKHENICCNKLKLFAKTPQSVFFLSHLARFCCSLMLL
jgi:hypothetical protein